MEEDAIERPSCAVGELDGPDMAALVDDAGDGGVEDGDAVLVQGRASVLIEGGGTSMGEERDLAGPGQKEEGEGCGLARPADDADVFRDRVGAVTIGAVVGGRAVGFGKSRDVGDGVTQAVAQDDTSGPSLGGTGGVDEEVVLLSGDGLHPATQDLRTGLQGLLAHSPVEPVGRQVVDGRKAVYRPGHAVARLTGIIDADPASIASQPERSRKAGRPAADHDGIE